MPPKKKKGGFTVSEQFTTVDPEIEDEIIEAYTNYLGEDQEDLLLKDLPILLEQLKIPLIFHQDIDEVIEYYYQFLHGKDLVLEPTNSKHYITLNLLRSFTITPTSAKSSNDLLDMIDLENLINQLNKLIKFRNNEAHIRESWKLFINSSSPDKNPDDFVLTLPDLKTVKTQLNLDNDPQTKAPLNDLFLIDMLGCCKEDSRGNLINFKFNKGGANVDIKDFAEILGRLGEYD
ncbi:uncharacterized protein KGF55_005524 [Candida pseudojiufengensis]|uniref:uncharacterized protein n=1 Tax=Candida pseudojiufengensis TaxID=497109 RepID=UPI00222488D5|nr:uncharacterized protein KGF55_005524 [Candida pseudojiufengensis]KAI5959181.1 hypothetical protein KGF55_005524 [Candida pseudojiufengensis]